MKTDRELTELAAKAAGIRLLNVEVFPNGYIEAVREGFNQNGGNIWNPLHVDSDALRLSVSLMLDIRHTTDEVAVLGYNGQWQHEPVYNDRPEATRRAIVRAAATYGKAMRDD